MRYTLHVRATSVSMARDGLLDASTCPRQCRAPEQSSFIPYCKNLPTTHRTDGMLTCSAEVGTGSAYTGKEEVA